METKTCNFCGEVVARSKGTCPSCKGTQFDINVVRPAPKESKIGQLLREEMSKKPTDSTSEHVDPFERLSEQIERSIQAQNRTTDLIFIIAQFIFSVAFLTFLLTWSITSALRGNPGAGLYGYWITYLLSFSFVTNRARIKLIERGFKVSFF